jgi:DNA sulfur modification protein DndD
MVMDVRVLGWSYRNIRGVKNLDISVEKNINQPYPVSMLMMQNGTGKTTTINLFRAVFDGQADRWDPTMVKGFQPPESNETQGQFKATLLIEGTLYVIYIKLDYTTGKASYLTSRDDEGGLDYGHNLPAELRNVFTTEFVKRFIFDGELAKEIIKSNSREAERAIRYLYQLNRLEDISNRVDEIINDAQQKADKTTAKTEKGLTRLRNDLTTYSKVQMNLSARSAIMDATIKEDQIELKAIDEKIIESIITDNSLREQAEKLTIERGQVDTAISDLTQSILNDIRNPYLLSAAISDSLKSLSDKLQQLKLPKTVSRQFFQELALSSPKCICGNDIGEKERQYILEKSEEFLADDQIGVINALKTAIRDRQYSEELSLEVSQLNEKINERRRIINDWDRLQTKRKESGDIELQKLQDQRELLQKSIRDNSEELNKITTKNRADLIHLRYIDNLYLCEEMLQEVEEKIAEATNTVELMHKSEKLKQYLAAIEKEALIRLKEKIKNETNDKLEKIIQTEPMVVERIDGSLKLKGKPGASEGQSLAIAYSFLGSMFDSSSHKLPFLVDTPTGPLDLDIRHQVSLILPKLFKQLIVFITSGEREGFSENFYELKNDVQFLTIIKRQGLPTECIEGIAMFQTFQDPKSTTTAS